jgi:hypothetical protein
VQSIVQGAVEFVCIGALEHHGKVFAIRPIGLVAQLGLDPVEEFCSRERIGNRNSDIIRTSIANQVYGRLNVLPRLSLVSELQEIARPNALAPQVISSLGNLFDSRSLIHGVQNSLRPGLDS